MAWSRRRFAVLACVLGAALVVGISAASGEGLKTSVGISAIDADSQASSTIPCAPGTKAVSGGFELEPPDPTALFAIASAREGARKWNSTGVNFGDDPATHLSYAYCRDQKVKAVAETTELDPLTDVALSARCPAGLKAVSGGFDAEFDDNTSMFVRASHKQGKRGWIVIARAFGSDPGTLRTQVNCHDGKKLRTKTKTETASGTEADDAVAKCKRRQRVVSGGFETEDFTSKGGPFVYVSRKQGRRKWLVTTLAIGPEVFSSFAYCEKKKAK